MILLLIVAFGVYFVYQGFSKVLPHHFLVPPEKWQDKIRKVVEYPKPIYLHVGTKRSSFRRRLVLASNNPSYYTNFVNNKLKVCPEDCNEEFMTEMRRRGVDDPNRRVLYGFFHPYANNGGGGERVLWQAVKSTLLAADKNVVAIYTINDAEPHQILQKAVEKFQITGLDQSRIVFIYLRRFGRLIDGSYWKHFTLAGQLFGSFLLALEAMYELSPDVWIDTIGLPGSYLPVHIILGAPIMAYVHYPIIQRDMFNKLKFSKFTSLVNLRGVGDVKEAVKFLYWTALYYFYTYLGSLVHVVLANGSWTFNHLQSIFVLNRHSKMEILYPPCGTENFKLSPPEQVKENKMLYIAQFRPEKRHSLILEEYALFLNKHKNDLSSVPTLVFLGSCRTSDDTDTLVSVKHQIKTFGLEEYVELVVDCSYDEVVGWLEKAKYGLNAMWNEHFGIGVVEYLGRAIPICHASAGPYLDIVTKYDQSKEYPAWHNDTGFFFKSESDPDYTHHTKNSDELVFDNKAFPSLQSLFTKLFVTNPELVSDDVLATMRSNGSQLAREKFSDQVFSTKWMEHIHDLDALEKHLREEKEGVAKVY